MNRLSSGGVFLALAIAILLSPAFLQPSDLLNIFRQASALGILSIAQTMVIIAGSVDLSVAARWRS